MDYRTAIVESLVEKIKTELCEENKGSKYFTDIDRQVFKGNKSFEEISEFPAISVCVGTEKYDDEESTRFTRFTDLAIYIRMYVKGSGETQEKLSPLVQDLKTLLDTCTDMQYNIERPDGEVVEESLLDLTLHELITDEGVLDPYGIGELNLTVRYTEQLS